ncbi:alpha/beta fold hydrolase [Flavobacterium kingsejongi]|uniref:Alpha/beta hydrolase n=1 Tax=Flavobacterium kingsejongi TaxID=1678728 RepID=A0A2S1LPI5_9FLAO|nr:alpha/beta hydrolase [Flavobacterium kingsejongi]AWG25546.1 alpha/beta hydrolase [Flavobacterium kingsejongi]
MKFIKSAPDSAKEVKIYYQDIGCGKSVIFIHGWPSSHEMWEYQLDTLPEHNIRAIAYDRRGFGKSDQPWGPYDYDTLALDLNSLLEELDLKDVTLVGFSMGGGEVVRYLSKYNTEGRVTKAALISSVVPYLLQTSDNPTGIPQEEFDKIEEGIRKDRPKFLADFAKQFYGVSLLNSPVSDEFLNWHQSLTLISNGNATVKTMHSWSQTDFRADLAKISVPILIVHGDADKTVPIKSSSDLTAKYLPQAEYLIYEGAPHGLFYTEKDRLNQDLLNFISR